MADHLHALRPGTLVDGYEIVSFLGSGGFGITYLARDVALDKPVAIKEYMPSDLAVRQQTLTVSPKSGQDKADFDWGLDRFLDEARTLARFDHPNVVKVSRFFRAHGTAYIVMEHVSGETLAEVLKRQGRLGEAELRSLLEGLLFGLGAVHAADYLHRDIKPGNVILRPDGTPVLLDFGSARQSVTAKSRSVTAIVTPGYAPIEQYSSRGNQGPWTDIYAVGAICYRAMTGEVPVDATERVRRDPLVAVSDHPVSKGAYSPAFLAAVDEALRVDEDERPQSVAEWRALLSGEAAPAKKLTPAELADPVRSLPQAGNRTPSSWLGDLIGFFIIPLLIIIPVFLMIIYVSLLLGGQSEDNRQPEASTPGKELAWSAPEEELAATARRVGEIFRDQLSGGGVGPEMVVIPSGSFTMETPENEKEKDGNVGSQQQPGVPKNSIPPMCAGEIGNGSDLIEAVARSIFPYTASSGDYANCLSPEYVAEHAGSFYLLASSSKAGECRACPATLSVFRALRADQEFRVVEAHYEFGETGSGGRVTGELQAIALNGELWIVNEDVGGGQGFLIGDLYFIRITPGAPEIVTTVPPICTHYSDWGAGESAIRTVPSWLSVDWAFQPDTGSINVSYEKSERGQESKGTAIWQFDGTTFRLASDKDPLTVNGDTVCY